MGYYYMKEKIYAIIKKFVGNHSNVNDDALLMEIGIDSVTFISMIIEIEEEFNIRFDDMQLIYDNYKTIGQFIEMIIHMIENS